MRYKNVCLGYTPRERIFINQHKLSERVINKNNFGVKSMNTIKKSLLVLTIIGLLFLMACAGTQQPAETTTGTTENGPIKIGVIAPLTGNEANYGADSIGGIQIATDEINAAGGVNGRQIMLVQEDDQCSNTKMATQAAQKLVDVDKVVAIVGQVCSGSLLATAPIVEAAKVTTVACCTSNPAITQAGDYIFRAWPSDALQGKDMANYVYNVVGARTAATIYTTSDYNYALQDVFAKEFERLGGSIVAQETYAPDAKDFRTQITKINAKTPDAVYVVPYGEGGLVLKQMKELNLNAKVFASETIASKEVIQASAGAAQGVIYATPSLDTESPKTKEFLQKFKAKYNKDPAFAVIAADAYDAMKLVAEGLKTGVNSDAVKTYLYTVKDYNGAGGMLTIDSNGDALKTFQLMKIEGEEGKPLKP